MSSPHYFFSKQLSESIAMLINEGKFQRYCRSRPPRNFDSELLASAILVYIDCPFEICWKRNVERHERKIKAGHDDHLVSREEMEKSYLTDNYSELTEHPDYRDNIFYIDNSGDYAPDDFTNMENYAKKLVEEIKQRMK